MRKNTSGIYLEDRISFTYIFSDKVEFPIFAIRDFHAYNGLLGPCLTSEHDIAMGA